MNRSKKPSNTKLSPTLRNNLIISNLNRFVKSALAVILCLLILATPVTANSSNSGLPDDATIDAFDRVGAFYYNPSGNLCFVSKSATSPTSTNTGDIPYNLPAASGGYGHEEAILADGTIPSGGSVTFSGLASRLPQAYRDYAINMRWNYVSWYWNGRSASSGGDGSYGWFAERPRMILVTNPETGKSIYAAALEAGPAPWTGYGLTSNTIGNPPSWWRQPQFGTPQEYQGRVSGLTPTAYRYLEDGTGDGQRNVLSDGSVKGPTLFYEWAEDQTVMPGPTDQMASGAENFVECSSGGALSPGGITDMSEALALAQEFIDYVNSKVGGTAPSVPSRASFNQALGTPARNYTGMCDGVSCGQCTALSMWFVTYKTNYTYGAGNGADVVRNLAGKNRDLQTGSEPLQPYAIFSWKESSNPAGHTGIVIGILDDGSIITLENNMASNQLMVRQLSQDQWRTRVANAVSSISGYNSQFAFAYVGDKLK